MGLSGWNISKLTGHESPKLGGYAYDVSRNRLWITERDYGVFRLDLSTTDYEYERFPLPEPSYYGPIGVLKDGSAMVAAINGDRILRYDADVNALPDIPISSILDLNVYRDAVGVVTQQGAGIAVSCLNAAGQRLWRTHVADGPTCNYFDGFSSVFCTDDGIMALVGQKHIECVMLDYAGKIVSRKLLPAECGSWKQEFMAKSDEDSVRPTGRRYLIDAAYNHRGKSLWLLYAPPAGDHGLVLVEWPLGDADPVVYEVPEWTMRIISVAGRLLCYGSETFSGPKMMHVLTPSEGRTIPTSEIPSLFTATIESKPNLLQDLFAVSVPAAADSVESPMDAAPDQSVDLSSSEPMPWNPGGVEDVAPPPSAWIGSGEDTSPSPSSRGETQVAVDQPRQEAVSDEIAPERPVTKRRPRLRGLSGPVDEAPPSPSPEPELIGAGAARYLNS